MVGWNNIDNFRESNDYREHLNLIVKENNPLTNTPQSHMVYKNPIE